MGKLSLGRVLDCLYLSTGSKACFCLNAFENEDGFERKALVGGDFIRLKNDNEGPKTLAFQLKPKIVVLRVSMHCNGCARQIQKHISKIEGVTSYEVDLETKMVVVTGDILPFEVLQSISKVKMAELWTDPS